MSGTKVSKYYQLPSITLLFYADTKYKGHVTVNMSHIEEDLGNGGNYVHNIGHKEAQKGEKNFYTINLQMIIKLNYGEIYPKPFDGKLPQSQNKKR